jgi:hypothetical protein
MSDEQRTGHDRPGQWTATTPPAMPTTGQRRRITAGLPMYTALFAVAVVWVLGCVWSYQEQSAFALSKGFAFPHLLPLVIDGFAVSMAGVAWAASLDARPAVPARLATLLAVAGSAASNGVWAWLRTDHDRTTVVLAVAVPVAGNLAFEVLLAELRRQVQRRRGLPAPVALPALPVIRLVLAPASTFRAWRGLVLDLTEPAAALPAPANGAGGLDAYVSTPRPDERDGGALSRSGVQWDTPGWDGPGVPTDRVDGTQEVSPFAVNGGLDCRATPDGPDATRGGGPPGALSQADRARTVAELHASRTGALPSVRELAGMADVGRGTAARELAALRERLPGLHEVANEQNARPTQ